ncbi:WDR74 protein, partial [Dromaius novaehollandiae]|nr:WDR74 protein [Dromaius novaehollandiae]
QPPPSCPLPPPGRLLRCLKGVAGGVRGLQCHPHRPLVASCGLDRFLRVHGLGDKRPQHKVYLKSRLNCLLLSSRQDWEAPEAPSPAADGDKDKDGDKEEDDADALWAAMEPVPPPAPPGRRPTKRKSSGL